MRVALYRAMLAVPLAVTSCADWNDHKAAKEGSGRPAEQEELPVLAKERPFVAKPPDTALYADRDVGGTLGELKQRMYAIGEVNGDLGDWDAAVAGAAVHIADRMKDSRKHLELITPVSDTAPLALAAMNGYPQVVETLLTFNLVKKTIEEPGPYGMTPWQLTNLAPQLSLAVINPTIMTDAWKFVPWMVKTPYYTHSKLAPYTRTRAALERAGAVKDISVVRKFLQDSPVCPDEVKDRVVKADDFIALFREIVLHDRTFGLPSLTGGN